MILINSGGSVTVCWLQLYFSVFLVIRSHLQCLIIILTLTL